MFTLTSDDGNKTTVAVDSRFFESLIRKAKIDSKTRVIGCGITRFN